MQPHAESNFLSAQNISLFVVLSLTACQARIPHARLQGEETQGVEKAVRLSITETPKRATLGSRVGVTVLAENTSKWPVALNRFYLEVNNSIDATRAAFTFPMYSSDRLFYKNMTGEINDKRAVVNRTLSVDAVTFGTVEFADGSVAVPGRGPMPPRWRYVGDNKMAHFRVLMPGETTTFTEHFKADAKALHVNAQLSYCVLEETLPILRRSHISRENLLKSYKPGDRIIAKPVGWVDNFRERHVYQWTTVAKLTKPKEPFVEGRHPVKAPKTERLPLTANEQLYPHMLPREEFKQLRGGKFSVVSRAATIMKVDAIP